MGSPAPTRWKEKPSGNSSSKKLLTALPVHPVSAAIALRAGQIDGQNQVRGVRLPLSDLLIGVTALELGYSVATGNVRHFQQVPGLSVIQL